MLARCAIEDQAMVLRLDAALWFGRRGRSTGQGGRTPCFTTAIRTIFASASGAAGAAAGTAGDWHSAAAGGDAETRDLVMAGDLLLVVDGAAGRVIGMDRLSMGWKLEKRFYIDGAVQRLRVCASPNRLQIVLAERTDAGGPS